MANTFMVSKELVNVSVDYAELSNGEIVVLNTEEMKSQFGGKCKTAHAKFAKSGWSSYNSYMSGIIDRYEDGSPRIDIIKLRDGKFRKLLKELMDGDGNNILMNKDFFDNCSPDLAMAMVDAYDNILEKERLQLLKESGITIPDTSNSAPEDIESPSK